MKNEDAGQSGISKGMSIAFLKENMSPIWDDFCKQSDDAWFLHTSDYLNYCESYGKEKYKTRNLSFILNDAIGPVGICPLLLEKNKDMNGKEIFEFSASASGGYGVAPALRNDLTDVRRDKILFEIFKIIDELANEYKVSRVNMCSTTLANRLPPFNMFMKYGYLDHSLNTQLIDLTLPIENIWSDLRKGHKYDVRSGEKAYKIHIFSKINMDKRAFDEYRLLHHKAAGRITRPIATFEMMYEWIKAGMAMLCGVSQDEHFIGFSYFCLYKDAAEYSSASEDPDFKNNVPISHAIQWAVIKWLKDNGYKKYEIGQQQFGPQIYDVPSPKDLNISFFKRGFGGKTVPIFRGVKYYDKNLLKEEMQSNLERLISNEN